MPKQLTIPGTHAYTYALVTDEGKPIGLDWAQIDHRYQQTCSPEEKRGAVPITPRAAMPTGRGTGYKGGTREQGPITNKDVDKMVELYKAGQRVLDIAPQIPASQRTVRKYLEQRKVYDPSRDRKNKGTQ